MLCLKYDTLTPCPLSDDLPTQVCTIRILFIIFSPIKLEKGDRRAAARVQDSFSVLLLIRRDLQKHLALQLGQHNQNLYNDMKYVLEFFLYANRNGGLNFEISQLLHELGIQKNILTFVL